MIPFRGARKEHSLFRITSIKYSTLCLIVTFLAMLISLLPLNQGSFGARADSSSSALEKAFYDPTYQTSLLLSAVITIPMVADLLLDMIYVFKGNSGEILHWSIRLLLLAALTVPNIAIYNSHFGSYSASFVYLCVSNLRVITAAGCLSVFISLGEDNLGAGWKSVAILTFFALGQLLLLFDHLSSDHNDTIFAVAFVFLSASGLLLLQYASLSLYVLWTTETRLTSDNVCFIFYFTAIVLFSTSGLAITSLCGSYNPYNYSARCLVSFEYLQMGFLVFVMVLPGRIVRYKLDGTIRQMKERQSFMRYISHEIRTPLNTVFLGMTFVRSCLTRCERLVDTVSTASAVSSVPLSSKRYRSPSLFAYFYHITLQALRCS